VKAIAVREAAKLETLRNAAALGIGTIEKHACRDFGSFAKLGDYLRAATDKVIAGAATE
jgi:hypothetical protein